MKKKKDLLYEFCDCVLCGETQRATRGFFVPTKKGFLFYCSRCTYVIATLIEQQANEKLYGEGGESSEVRTN